MLNEPFCKASSNGLVVNVTDWEVVGSNAFLLRLFSFIETWINRNNGSLQPTLKKYILWCAKFGYLFSFSFIGYVLASIAYYHPVYGGIRTHDLLDVKLLP